MPVILRDVPPGYHWGWYAREDPRMHIQTIDRRHRNDHKIWLEEKGRRVFQPVGAIPGKILKRVQTATAQSRAAIEAEWVHWMIELDWLLLEVRGTSARLIAYPHTPNRFERLVDLAEFVGEKVAGKLSPADVKLNSELAVIEIWPQKPESRRPFIEIAAILWQD